jgi:hypothetical protein
LLRPSWRDFLQKTAVHIEGPLHLRAHRTPLRTIGNSPRLQTHTQKATKRTMSLDQLLVERADYERNVSGNVSSRC